MKNFRILGILFGVVLAIATVAIAVAWPGMDDNDRTAGADNCGLNFAPSITCTTTAHIGNRECFQGTSYACFATCVSDGGTGVKIIKGECLSGKCDGGLRCKAPKKEIVDLIGDPIPK